MYVIKNVSFHLGFFLFQNVSYFLDSTRICFSAVCPEQPQGIYTLGPRFNL